MHRRIRDPRVSRARGTLGPWLWQQGAPRQGSGSEHRDQERDPAAAKDTPHAPAGRPALAALAAQGRGHRAPERAKPIPRLHKASPVACGWLKGDNSVRITVVHSSTRLWPDIVARLGVMGCMGTLRIVEGGLSCHG
jgi:hypothetical protein